MSTDSNAPNETSFVRQRLPWLIGAGGLLFFLLTLNHWISLLSLGTVARTAGWLWQPEVGRPLSLLILAPFRLLPEAWLPMLLNIFTALCAALVLVQLARTVALLRYQVPSDDPFHQGKTVSAHLTTPAAWMPPTLAALVCGLQLTFWENATSASGEMLSLLCFAYALRCLPEFQASGKAAWLYRGVAVYAAGMAENWMLLGYAPVFVAALVWIKGLRPILEFRFLLRLVLCALAGLSLYLVVPALTSLSSQPALDFETALLAQVNSQKQALLLFRHPAFRLMVVMALLPALVLTVRWRSHTVQFADDTRLGVFFVKATGHLVHALFLIAALWIILNPGMTAPRLEMPLLPFYYVWALVGGYGAGYFLWFKASRPPRRTAKPAVWMLASLLGVMPVLLIWKNFPEVRATNSPALREFARLLCDNLPTGKSAVLSEDVRQLLLVRAELAARGDGRESILVETPSLLSPRYHAFMTGHYAGRWPQVGSTNAAARIGPVQLLELVTHLAASQPVVYLHPSSGFFFETFVGEPHGLVQHLQPRGPGDARSVLPASEAAANENLWQQRWSQSLEKRAQQFAAVRQNAANWSRLPLHLARRQNATVSFLSAAYGKALNHWGVRARRAGIDAEVGKWFERALKFAPDNLAARLNLEYARRGERGDRSRLKVNWAKQLFPELFGQHDSWWEVLSLNGPVDEPTFLLQTGRVWLGARQPQQAAEAFARCAELAPEWISPRLWHAQSLNARREFAQALELTQTILPDAGAMKAAGLAQLLSCRIIALRGLGQTNDAAAFLDQFVSAHRMQPAVLNAAAGLYAGNAQFDRELELREALLQRAPNNPELLARKGISELRLERYEAAIVTLTKALTINPASGQTRFLRAVAHLRAGQLEASKADYRELLKTPDRSQSALFGLGSIAWREDDTNAVIYYYQQFLSNSAAMSPQFNIATERLLQMTDDQ